MPDQDEPLILNEAILHSCLTEFKFNEGDMVKLACGEEKPFKAPHGVFLNNGGVRVLGHVSICWRCIDALADVVSGKNKTGIIPTDLVQPL
ncbi:MAG: hypothetical protein AAB495_01665 [Patescibacteria group bacterium]